MPSDPTNPGSARSAADELNDEIRDLWFRAGGTLTPDERAEYEQLVARWAAALKSEIAEAA